MEDSRIIELYWMRNSDAIIHSKEKYGSYCFTVANNILGNYEDSEECVNDTWLHAWNAMPPHRPTALRMFFAKITRSVSFDCFKRRCAQKRGSGEITAVLDELSECIAIETDIEDELITKELGECIRLFIRTLPEREGDIFLRRYFFTETLEQISRFYSLTPGHTAVILSRTRSKLKVLLIKEGYLHE